MMRANTKLIALCALALAGCHSGKPAKSDDQRSATGEVLKGSVSDAMLPYDTTKSQPPLAPRVVEHSADGEADSAAPAEADSAAAAPKAEAPKAAEPGFSAN